MCLPNALLLCGCGCGLHSLPIFLFINLAYINYFYRPVPSASIAQWTARWILNPYFLGSNLSNCIIFFHFFFFFFFFFCHFYFSANSTLLSLLRFSYFITPYDAQASSAFSALIKTEVTHKTELRMYAPHVLCFLRRFCAAQGANARACTGYLSFHTLASEKR